MIAIDQIQEEVRCIDPNLGMETSEFETAVLPLAALQVGQRVSALAKFTGYPQGFIKPGAERLRKNGIWRRGTTYAGWFEEETGGVAFWCDAAVAEGLLEGTER